MPSVCPIQVIPDYAGRRLLGGVRVKPYRLARLGVRKGLKAARADFYVRSFAPHQLVLRTLTELDGKRTADNDKGETTENDLGHSNFPVPIHVNNFVNTSTAHRGQTYANLAHSPTARVPTNQRIRKFCSSGASRSTDS